MAQQVKNLPAMQGTQVQSQGGEEPLEEEMATHSNILAWEIPRTEQPGGLQSIGLQRVGYNRASKHIGNDFRMLSISGLHYIICTSSVQSLGHIQLFETPWTAQHTRLPRPSLTPRACSNSCSLSQWCHPTISFSIIPFSCPSSFPASRSFPMNRLFASGSQSIVASASVLPGNIQGWFPLWNTSSRFAQILPLVGALGYQFHKTSHIKPSILQST